MEFIYPARQTDIYVPVELNGKPGKAVFEVAHRNPETMIYWHLDNNYLGMTKHIHQMGLYPQQGPHLLTIVDENGNKLTKQFTVLTKTRT